MHIVGGGDDSILCTLIIIVWRSWGGWLCVFIPAPNICIYRWMYRQASIHQATLPVFTLWWQMNYIRPGLRSPQTRSLNSLTHFGWKIDVIWVVSLWGIHTEMCTNLVFASQLDSLFCICGEPSSEHELNCIYHNSPITNEEVLLCMYECRLD